MLPVRCVREGCVPWLQAESSVHAYGILVGTCEHIWVLVVTGGVEVQGGARAIDTKDREGGILGC